MKEDIKRYWKFYVLGFILAFVFFNWSDIILQTNYKVVWFNIQKVFNKEVSIERPSISEIVQEVRPEKIEIKEEEIIVTPNKIVIDNIKTEAPIVMIGNSEIVDSKKALKQGVLLYDSGSRPGKEGVTYILGHSAPNGWPDIYYDNIFNDINLLNNNDKIDIYYENRKYTYSVFDQKIFYPKDEDKVLYVPDEGSYLILITCWPKGSSLKRMAVFARLDK